MGEALTTLVEPGVREGVAAVTVLIGLAVFSLRLPDRRSRDYLISGGLVCLFLSFAIGSLSHVVHPPPVSILDSTMNN